MRKSLLAVGALALAFALAAPTLSEAQGQKGKAKAAQAAAIAVQAAPGVYGLDKSHASLTWKVSHLGLSMYTARFTDFDATLNFNPTDPAAMSVNATINANSVETDYPGNYKATHANSPYASWDEDLAKNPEWFNAGANPQITFASTGVKMKGPRKAEVTGNLTFRGVTAPVTLDVTFNGEAKPPWLGGRSAVGFSAKGTLSRSAFGMARLVPNIGDAVEIQIEAEFQQKPA
jgi:polyisoprenoid-binding protein YceI